MDHYESSRRDADPMYDDIYLQYINQFMAITSKEFAPQDIVDVLQKLKTSKYVLLLMAEPTNVSAASCIHSFMQKETRASPGFLDRLRAVFQTQIKILPAVFGSSMSGKVKVNVGNCEPTSKMNVLTANAKRAILDENMCHFQTLSIPYNAIVPQTVRINMDQSLLEKSVNSMMLLAKVIKEGNRQNGKEIDDYIKEQLQ